MTAGRSRRRSSANNSNNGRSSRPRQDVGTVPEQLAYHQVLIRNLPKTTTTRKVRKKIGRATYWLQRTPHIRFVVKIFLDEDDATGRITFGLPRYAALFLEVFGGPHTRWPIVVDGHQLRFYKITEPVDRYFLRAICNPDNEGEVDSDYDEEGDAKDIEAACSPNMPMYAVDCGAFDEAGEFCVGWKRKALSPHTFVSFDIDEARLRIRVEKLVIETTIYNIAKICIDEANGTVYWVFKYAPMFLRDLPPADEPEPDAWIEIERYDHDHPRDRFERVGGYDKVHEGVTPHCLIYRTHTSQFAAVHRFFQACKGRLRINHRIAAVKDADIQSCAEAFDMRRLEEIFKKLDFELAMQLQALLHPMKLLPKDLVKMAPDLTSMQRRVGEREARAAIRSIRGQLKERGPIAQRSGISKYSAADLHSFVRSYQSNKDVDVSPEQRNTLVYTVFITPSSALHVEGPHYDEGNRILRLYPDQVQNFVRVRFTDEDGSQIRVAMQSGNIDADIILSEYIRGYLRCGITVGGRSFDFLAYSQSGLREHTCWFVRPFKVNGHRVTADAIRGGIGDLSHIRSPARYAARMGQAFSASSIGIQIPRSAIIEEDDIHSADGMYQFTDGVGLMSPLILERIHVEMEKRGMYGHLPTAVQIRLGGAKGMLNVDPRLEGEVVVLRKSMIKFALGKCQEASLDVANFWAVPMVVYTNRQLIALLESLGVPSQNFIRLQEESIVNLARASDSHDEAWRLLNRSGVKRHSIASASLKWMQTTGLKPTNDVPFLREGNLSLANFALRTVKYRARVVLPNSYTLPGIADYTGKLTGHQVVVCIAEPGMEPRYLSGDCVVGRSPMLAPGDVQFAKAFVPPLNDPLRAQKNVVIFATKGKRPLPSKLGGGDLDGDLYNIIMDPCFFPQETRTASNYPPVKPSQLGRTCTTDDVIDFFLDFIKHEKVGIIAMRHLLVSDQAANGILDSSCVRLAEMHSCAVDYGKSGRAPRLSDMPRGPRQKPDFLQKEFRVETVLRDDRTIAQMHPRSKDLYYQSEKALGHMFRAIDVKAQLRLWEMRSQASTSEPWQVPLWRALLVPGRPTVLSALVPDCVKHVRQYYRRMEVLAHEHGTHDGKLTEEEVFMGHVICRTPEGTRMSPFDVVQRLQDDFADLCTETQLKVLLEKGRSSLEPPVHKLVWAWLTFKISDPITDEDLLGLTAIDDVGGPRKVALKFLFSILLRGLPYVRAAVNFKDDVLRGRSAPFVIIPALLKAHSIIDALNSFDDDDKQENPSASERDDAISASASNAGKSTEGSSRESETTRSTLASMASLAPQPLIETQPRTSWFDMLDEEMDTL